MLKRYSETFRAILLVTDLALVAASWLAAYEVRFALLPTPHGVPEFHSYLLLLPLILGMWFLLFRARGLYQPRRTLSLFSEAGAVLAATTVGVLVLVAITFFARSYFYSRGVIALFYGFSAGSVVAFRVTGRLLVRALRRRGYNLRYVVIVGAGELAGQVIDRIHGHPEAGFRVVGVLSDDTARHGRSTRGVPVVAGYGDIKSLLRGRQVDQVLVALPKEDVPKLEKILADLDDELVSVRLIPDLLHVMTLRACVEDLDGLPVINLRETPMVGIAALQKRLFDVVVSAIALLLTAPLLASVALAIRLSSGRPVFYGQERMGLDGRVFPMLKFRTMVPDAEQHTGPVWTTARDPRRTPLGRFLRRTSLDELPQLWNVLRGDMSLVGPRPERPVFIERFRREIPGYMLRHKVKSGITGWAQVHGWRGNTSVHERIEHDIYYIQNWSLGLDVRILLMTLWRGLIHGNAY